MSYCAQILELLGMWEFGFFEGFLNWHLPTLLGVVPRPLLGGHRGPPQAVFVCAALPPINKPLKKDKIRNIRHESKYHILKCKVKVDLNYKPRFVKLYTILKLTGKPVYLYRIPGIQIYHHHLENLWYGYFDQMLLLKA